MRSLSLCALLVLLGSTSFAVSEQGLDTKFTLTGDIFEQNIGMTFKPGLNLESVVHGMSDGDLMNEMSQNIIAVKFFPLGPDLFEMAVTGEKSFIGISFVRTTWFTCQINLNETTRTWTQNCGINLAKGDTRSLFKAGQNYTVCTEKKNAGGQEHVVCKATFRGEPKKVGNFIKSFSAQQMAIRGASENIQNLGGLLMLLNGEVPNVRSLKEQLPQSPSGQLQSKTFFDGERFITTGQVKNGRTMTIEGSTRSSGKPYSAKMSVP